MEQQHHNMEKYTRETALADQDGPKAPCCHPARSKWGHRASQTTRQDRTNLGRSVTEILSASETYKGTTGKTCGSSTGLDGVGRIHFMISSYCSRFKSDSQQFLLKSNMLLLSLHITKI